LCQDLSRRNRLGNILQRAVRSELRAALGRHELRQPPRIDFRILTKLDSHQIALALDRSRTHAHSEQLERRVFQKVPHRSRRLTVAVFQFGADIVQARLGFHPSHPLIHSQALVLFRNIFHWDANIESQV